MKTRTAIVAAIACLAAPSSAAASSWLDPGEPTFVPVAEGQVEHAVWEATITHPKGSSVNRREVWVAAGKARNLGTSGGHTWEDDAVPGRWRTWKSTAPEQIRVYRTSTRDFLLQSVAGEAAIMREQVAAGWLRVAEETTLDGRPVHVLVNGPADPNQGRSGEERVVVDAASYEVLERGLVTEHIRTVNRRVAFEVLDRTPELEAQLQLDKPGAVEVGGGDESSAFAAKRKAAAKKRAAAKKKAAAKRRAAARRR